MPKRAFYQISLKIILKNNKNEVLILNGCSKGSYAGFYDLPGGRIDEDESDISFLDIIKREAKEEIGNVKMKINPKPIDLGRHVVPASMTSENKNLHVLYIFFEAEFISGDIAISKEHEGFKWANLKETKPEKLFKSGILEGINMYLGIK